LKLLPEPSASAGLVVVVKVLVAVLFRQPLVSLIAQLSWAADWEPVLFDVVRGT
jgi:hypothetical protein